MVSAEPFQKIIDGVAVTYDPKFDIIARATEIVSGTPLDRTQVDSVYDLCAEITTWCNHSCLNCFSNSAKGVPGKHLRYGDFVPTLQREQHRLIRFSITGGEPFMHPEIESFLQAPQQFTGLGFVITTNGTLRADLDPILVDQNWLVAISLHGRATVHNAYSRADTFAATRDRVMRLARQGRVHIYTVVHDALTVDDIEWLVRFRAESGAMFLRFIVPRNFGRYRKNDAVGLLDEIMCRLDGASAIKINASKTLFLDVDGRMRSAS